MIASSRWETFNFQSIIPFINVFFSVKTVISATFSTVMMGLWELIWLFRWVWEIPSQRFLIGGKYRITWGPAIHHPCIAPAQDLQTQAVQREERPAYLEKASWVIKRHCISPLPLLDPSRDCDHCHGVGRVGTPCHLWLEAKKSNYSSGDYVEPTTAITLGAWSQAELY